MRSILSFWGRPVCDFFVSQDVVRFLLLRSGDVRGVGAVMTICGSRFLPWNEGPLLSSYLPVSSTLVQTCCSETGGGGVLNGIAK